MIFGLISIVATLGLRFLHLLIGHYRLPLGCVILLGIALLEAIIEMFGKKLWVKIFAIGLVTLAIVVVGYFAAYQGLGWIPLK